MRITLTNNFHNTAIDLTLKHIFLSGYQIRKAQKVLCPTKKNGCICSNVAGMRGPQTAPIVGQENSFNGLVPRFEIT